MQCFYWTVLHKERRGGRGCRWCAAQFLLWLTGQSCAPPRATSDGNNMKTGQCLLQPAEENSVRQIVSVASPCLLLPLLPTLFSPLSFKPRDKWRAALERNRRGRAGRGAMAALTHFCRAWREGRREVTQVRKQNSCTRESRNLNYSSAVACLWMFCYNALSLGFLRMECGVWQRKGFIFSAGAFCRVPPAKMCASLANRDAIKAK